MLKKDTTFVKMKLKKGDIVIVVSGKDKGKKGKVLLLDRKKNKLIVEGVNKIKKHQKPNKFHQQGGIIEKEAYIHASNVMYFHNGKPTKIAIKLEESIVDGKKVITKTRIAKTTNQPID